MPDHSAAFYITWQPDGNNTHFSSHAPPPKFPAFILALNDGWNDYSVKTEFYLFYYKSEQDRYKIGSVKIMNEDLEPYEVLESPFINLPETFCSLGQRYGYYQELKALLGKNFESVLWALKDAAFFPEMSDKFEKHETFKNSLIRFDEPEQLLREAKYRVYDYNLSDLYSFKYSFTPKLSKDSVDIEFSFDNNEDFANRIYALIGKNGTGKTQLMTTLPFDTSRKDDGLYTVDLPVAATLFLALS